MAIAHVVTTVSVQSAGIVLPHMQVMPGLNWVLLEAALNLVIHHLRVL
jgi:hypothetical protein